MELQYETIKIKATTLDILNKNKRLGETFDDVIRRLSSGIIGEPRYG